MKQFASFYDNAMIGYVGKMYRHIMLIKRIVTNECSMEGSPFTDKRAMKKNNSYNLSDTDKACSDIQVMLLVQLTKA